MKYFELTTESICIDSVIAAAIEFEKYVYERKEWNMTGFQKLEAMPDDIPFEIED